MLSLHYSERTRAVNHFKNMGNPLILKSSIKLTQMHPSVAIRFTLRDSTHDPMFSVFRCMQENKVSCMLGKKYGNIQAKDDTDCDLNFDLKTTIEVFS